MSIAVGCDAKPCVRLVLMVAQPKEIKMVRSLGLTAGGVCGDVSTEGIVTLRVQVPVKCIVVTVNNDA